MMSGEHNATYNGTIVHGFRWVQTRHIFYG